MNLQNMSSHSSLSAPAEHELISECQNGNLQSFAGLYEQYVEKVYGFVFHKVFNRQHAEDITANVFHKALEKIESFDPEKAKFSTWLFAIARNAVIDFFRTSRRNIPLEDMWDLPSDENVEQEAEIQLLFEKLQKKMQMLSAEQREILMLRFWQGYSFPEIADILGKSEASVKMATTRSVRKLKEHFVLFALFSTLFL